MNEICMSACNAGDDERIDQLESFQSLAPGHYWRMVRPIHKMGNRSVGEVLLVTNVHLIEGRVHSVTLHGHPSRQDARIERAHTESFMIEEFERCFEYEPDGEKIRDAEIAAIQQEVHELQEELVRLQADPVYLKSLVESEMASAEASRLQHIDPSAETKTNLPSTHLMDGASLRTDVGFALEKRITQADVDAITEIAKVESERARVTAKLLTRVVEKVSSTLSKIGPYYAERAAAALARTNDIREYAKEISDGIRSMDLYTGRGVEVHTLCTGEPAPAGEPLTLMQRKLFLAEEVAVFIDVDEDFDHFQTDKVMHLIKTNPAFLQQLMPAQRCVVSVAMLRQEKNYDNVFEGLHSNSINRSVFLLVRNGENVHQVFSCEKSHECAERLFPAHDEFDRIFSGVSGDAITYNDLRYVESRMRASNLSLHYKRFLILLCGLDHRLGLMGEFYPPEEATQFLKLSFQQKYFQFAHDDERGALLSNRMYESVRDFTKRKNASLRSGSLVACFFRDLISPKTAPGAFSYRSYGGAREIATRTADWAITRAQRQGTTLYIPVAMNRLDEYDDVRPDSVVNIKVRIADSGDNSAENGVLCLDNVSSAELEQFVYDRNQRIHHLGYLRLFRRAIAVLKGIEAELAPVQETLAAKALERGFARSLEQARELAAEALAHYRVAKLQDPESLGTEKALKDMLKFIQASRVADQSLIYQVQDWANSAGHTLIRLSLGRTGELIAYLAQSAPEQFAPMNWPWALRLQLKKSGDSRFDIKSESHVWLTAKPPVNERVLHWYSPQDTCDQVRSEPVTYTAWMKMVNGLYGLQSFIDEHIEDGRLSVTAIEQLFSRYKVMVNSKKTIITYARLLVPVALYLPQDNQSRPPVTIALSFEAVSLMYRLANDQQREKILNYIKRLHMRPSERIKHLKYLELIPEIVFLPGMPELLSIHQYPLDTVRTPRALDCDQWRYEEGNKWRSKSLPHDDVLRNWRAHIPAHELKFAPLFVEGSADSFALPDFLRVAIAQQAEEDN